MEEVFLLTLWYGEKKRKEEKRAQSEIFYNAEDRSVPSNRIYPRHFRLLYH